MEILGQTHLFDMPKLVVRLPFLHWLVSRQMSLEGGFQGRCNKLVDGCYSFWVGGVFPLIEAELERQWWRTKRQGVAVVGEGEYGWGKGDCAGTSCTTYLRRLMEYVLVACQDEYGGLRDKPGKTPDFYHTCYGLSGLSTAQHYVSLDLDAAERVRERGLDASRGGLASLMWRDGNEFIVV
ncbi:terpenoid cyclases/protein prenyltransferase alpha-alpha toroid, partial [Jimgerdemannia flammicorona]